MKTTVIAVRISEENKAAVLKKITGKFHHNDWRHRPIKLSDYVRDLIKNNLEEKKPCPKSKSSTRTQK